MIWLLALTLAGAAGDPPSAASPPYVAATDARAVELMLASESRRLRSGSARVTKLVRDGIRRSRTFADLVAKIHHSNVIVYVETSFNLSPDMAGRTMLQTVAGGQRYLRVQVKASLQGDQVIAVIAHELLHALEVAADPSVVDDAGLVALYRRIGHASYGASGYDTEAARAIGKRVRDELVG
jgi:hypothetical protein